MRMDKIEVALAKHAEIAKSAAKKVAENESNISIFTKNCKDANLILAENLEKLKTAV